MRNAITALAIGIATLPTVGEACELGSNLSSTAGALAGAWATGGQWYGVLAGCAAGTLGHQAFHVLTDQPPPQALSSYYPSAESFLMELSSMGLTGGAEFEFASPALGDTRIPMQAR